MAALDQGPCQNWPSMCVVWPADAGAVTGFALQAATEVLWQKTHRRFGLCEEILRPCRQSCYGDVWLGSTTWPNPALIDGRWYNLSCGICYDECSCTTLHQIALPTPVAEILEVKVDGVVLPPTAYRVDDYRYLVRLDGESWPICNNLVLADTEVGTWSVRATYGEVVPTLGCLAVGELAAEIAKACTGQACLLPRRVTSIARQGVTKTFTDAAQAMSFGLVGLSQCDLFITTFNPGLSQRATIFNIDRKRQIRRVGT